MSLIKKIFRLIAEYFVFIGGLLFVFMIGAIFAFIRPEGYLVIVIFFAIAIGWIVFLIKYFWDLMEKK